MKYLIICADGLEDIAIEELKEMNSLKILSRNKGISVVEAKKITPGRCADDCLELLDEFEVNRYRYSLKKIRNRIKRLNIRGHAKASYQGRRDYTAKEIETVFYEAAGKDARQHYHIIIRSNTCYIGRSVLGIPVHDKYCIKTVPGSIRPSVACALLRIAEVKKGETVLDPMCGSGIIPIEATRLGAHGIGGDIDPARIRIAKENSKDAEFHVWDANKIPLNNKSVDYVISNIPFGKQIRDTGFNLDEFYRLARKRIILMNKGKCNADKSIRIINNGMESEISVLEVSLK